MPPFEPPVEIHFGGYTLVGNAFWGGLLFPTLVFAVLYAFPFIDRRWFGDRLPHHVLQRPRDNPRRTAWVAALLALVFTVFAAGAADRFFFQAGVSYELEVWILRALVIARHFTAQRHDALVRVDVDATRLDVGIEEIFRLDARGNPRVIEPLGHGRRQCRGQAAGGDGFRRRWHGKENNGMDRWRFSNSPADARLRQPNCER